MGRIKERIKGTETTAKIHVQTTAKILGKPLPIQGSLVTLIEIDIFASSSRSLGFSQSENF